MSKLIYIYKDNGCFRSESVESFIKKYVADISVIFVSADDIRSGILAKKSPYALFFGGGQTKYHKNKLKDKGIKEVLSYYKQEGSRLFGICAGAYLFAENVDYVGTLGISIVEKMKHGLAEGQFGFFKGIAKGRYFESEYVKEIKTVYYGDGKSARVLFARGPDLEGLSEDDEVLATFEDGSPAIIKCGENNHNVIISSVHLETDLNRLNELGLKSSEKELDDLASFILSKFFEIDNLMEANLSEDNFPYCEEVDVHDVNIGNRYFVEIASGKKKTIFMLSNELRQGITGGDALRLINLDNEEETALRPVAKVTSGENISQLIDEVGVEGSGFDNKPDLIDNLNTFFPQSKQRKYKAMAVELK